MGSKLGWKQGCILLNELTIWDSDYLYGCRMLQPGLQEDFWVSHPDEKYECHSEAKSQLCRDVPHNGQLNRRGQSHPVSVTVSPWQGLFSEALCWPVLRRVPGVFKLLEK